MKDIEIQVRTLTGESTIVSISPIKTIFDLKLLLNKSFSPAFNSPNFHLFFKGVKLSLQSQISSHRIESGDFIVLVPFKKKDQQQTLKPKVLATASASAVADTAWSDMMQDLSFLKGISRNSNQPDIELDITTKNSSSLKYSREFDGDKNEDELESIILSMLHSLDKNSVIDDKNCKSLIQALESRNCLANPISRNCMLVEDNLREKDKKAACLCPLWLKEIIKAFSFLNMYSTFLQLQSKKITLISLKEGLNQLSKFGFQVGISDLENLSVLCPKVVHFVDSETEGTKLCNSIVIIRSPFQEEDQVESKPTLARQNNMNPSKTVSAVKKREMSFKKNLWAAFKSLMDKKGNEMEPLYSLEDLLVFVKEGSSGSVKRSRGKCSGPSSTFESCCHESNPLLPAAMVEHLKMGIGSEGQIVHVEQINGRQANLVEIPTELSEDTKSSVKRLGITKLYSHQAESVKATLAGKNVVIATMTASGKSLCYNLPVVEVLSHNLLACALYIFPTKALAQDQLRALLAMTEGLDTTLNIGIYDGDTCQKDRKWLRDNARLLITNPDMLHMSILPFHRQFSRLLTNLRFVVIDEAHTYKGAFGCHTALILRRLRRLCSHVYGSDPSFVFCTATSANPREHAMELASLPTAELIQNDGSPSGPKHFVLWNPSLCLKTVSKRNRTETNEYSDQSVVVRRSSPIMELSCIFAEIVQHGLRCIAFCKTRKLCELVLSFTREILQKTAPNLVDCICAYRAGYLAEDRRRIESEFFGGTLCGVAATNALELGIDVGHIDVTLHLGFPGSIASLWQQAGRSGRREKASLAIYVAFDGPLDQYFMKFPHKLFGSPIECCHVDAKNQQMLEQHLACAAAEHPLSVVHDEKYFGSSLEKPITTLRNKGVLSTDLSRDYSARIWNYIGREKMPSRGISIRAIETERYKVIDKQKNQVLEEIEESKAFFQVHDGAVYMHQGRTYLVKDLNLTTKVALCQQADLNYYTKTSDYTDIHVIGGNIAYPRISNENFSRTTAQTNMCKVTTTWFGFHRIWKRNNELFDTVELLLPDYSYESQAVWIQVPQSVKIEVEIKQYSFRGGLHAACHALLNVVPLYVICNSSDLASECANPHDDRFFPERILLYDPRPGGTGMSAQVQPLFTELLTAALELLESCSCSGDSGCPNCVQNLSCHEYNEVLHKDAAILIIKGVLGAEKSYFKEMQCHSSRTS